MIKDDYKLQLDLHQTIHHGKYLEFTEMNCNK